MNTPHRAAGEPPSPPGLGAGGLPGRADTNGSDPAILARGAMQESTITPIPIDRIAPSPRNPRQSLDHLDELTDSIRAYGLLQPIVVREHDDGRFEVVAGHRRFAAVQSLGWSTVPAIVRQADQGEAYLLALIENLQRDNLSPREEAEALEILVRENRLSTRQVAEAVKRSASYVSRRLRVFEDPVLAPLVLQRALTV